MSQPKAQRPERVRRVSCLKLGWANRQKETAFTRLDLVVVIAVVGVLAIFLGPRLQRAYQQSSRICCNCNLKQIGAAYRIWQNDVGHQFPAAAPQTNGGWRNLLSLSNASDYVWTNYTLMSNELGASPLIVVCPADERKPANDFSNILANTNISYFVGVEANDNYPQSFLGGDRNLGPGSTPHADYGFSPADGKGADVTINGPVCWSLKMHSSGNHAGMGNILLGDGSAQQANSEVLRKAWLTNAFFETDAKLTNKPGMRLLFP